MTNRDLLNQLSNEEFANWIYKNIVNKIWSGTNFLAAWLEKEPLTYGE